MSELRTLLTPDALRMLDELGPLPSSDAAADAVVRLRAQGHAPELVAAVVRQARLRTRARGKFGPFAERMLFTPAGLEQATRLAVAARHAGRMRAAGIAHVSDLGCGIGADSLAFAGAGLRVTAVEADEVTAALAAFNLAPFGSEVAVRHGFAQDHTPTPTPSEAVWLDPARRTPGHSGTQRIGTHRYSPPLEWAYAVAERISSGIKLGPAHERDTIPSDLEAQWVSVDGDVVELTLWSGALARPGVKRAALVIRGDRSHELTASRDVEDAETRPLGAYLHEPDGAVIRARLIGDLARRLDAGMLDPHIAYLSSDSPGNSEFAASFRVREVLPMNPKAIGSALKRSGIGRLEIKKRGVDVDPAVFRKKLPLRGAAEATLILVRIGDTRHAILADRV